MSAWPPIEWSLNLPFTVRLFSVRVVAADTLNILLAQPRRPPISLCWPLAAVPPSPAATIRPPSMPAQPEGRSHWIALLERTVVLGEVENAERIGPFGVAETRLFEPATPT